MFTCLFNCLLSFKHYLNMFCTVLEWTFFTRAFYNVNNII